QGSGSPYTSGAGTSASGSNGGSGQDASRVTGTPSSSSSSSSSVSGASANPFLNSVPEGKATGTVLPLSFREALDRALRNNLGLLISTDNSLAARGAKWQELSRLLPNVHGEATQAAEQIDLAAQGFRFNVPGIPQVIGPIGTFDARAYVTAPLFDWNAIQRERGAKANEAAARYNYKSARDLVVLATGNEYLLTIAAASRVDAVQAEVETAQALSSRAHDQQTAGVSPAIDTLRAQVELQTRQQQLIVTRNDYAKQKLNLARTIGLPVGQEFNLTDQEPYQPLTPLSIEQALQRAYTSRSDYQAAAQQVLAAERFRRAAVAEHYPTVDFTGNYGASGVNIGNSHGVFFAGATLDIPIFAGGRARADILQAEAELRQSRQQLENLRAQIDYDVRTALLDLNAAADQVQVAKSALDLASQTLSQARDRFTAGVTDNLEVVQAQESVASANDNYISSLYAHNVAKVSLARAIGFAEEGVRQYLESKGK
ncbi:MAG: TolC family protein, partial [Acidobacteria bacterium]|nr:TolC family protein [Acidobacteriota bacterium]